MKRNSSTPSGDRALLERLWKEPVDRYLLANGLTVLLKHDSAAPVSSVQVWVKTGSIHEGANLGAGLSHYLEHMLFKGTERRSGRDITAAIQAHGGYINAYTTFDRTVYYIDMPAEHTGTAIDLLADAVLHSSLPAGEVVKERDVILREIDMCLDDPDQRLGQAMFETAFRTHPYREPIIGHRDVFSASTREELVAYYRDRYAPNNLVVVVVGDFDPMATRAAIAEKFGGLPRRRIAPVLVAEEMTQLAGRSSHQYEDVQVSRGAMGWQIPGLSHGDAPALDMLAMVLGHGDSSFLWRAVREKEQLVHTIDAVTWNPGSHGLFYVSFVCDPDKRIAAEQAVHREIGRVRARGIPTGVLAKAVRQAVTAEVAMRKTMSGQAARLGAAEVVVGDLDYNRRYFERLYVLKPSDLIAVLRTYLVPERLTVVSSNPKSVQPVPPAPPAVAGSSLDFEEVVLGNGARLLLQRNPRLPNLHLRLVSSGGPLLEPPDRRGANALLATMLTKDTTRRDAEEVATTIERVGGAFEEFSGNNSYGLYLETLPADAALAIDMLEDAVVRPAFKPERLRIERESALAALRESMDDVVTVGRKKLREKFFGSHPFAVESGGDEAGLGATGVTDLRRLQERLGTAGNTVLAVAGDFEPKRLVPRLKAFLERLKSGAVTVPAIPVQVVPGDHVEILPRQQAVVFQAFPGPGIRSPDYYVSEVADELFSGMAAHLFERVREQKSLAYFVRSSRVIGLDAGMFYFFAGTNPARHAEVLEEFAIEIERVQSGGVEAEELRRCQTRLKAARRMSMQSNGARAMQAALNAIYGLPVNDWRNYDAKIDRVGLDDLQQFARKYLVAASRTQLVVRP